MSTLEVPGYQPVHIDCDGSATVWLYMGGNFVVLSPWSVAPVRPHGRRGVR
jgi:hypothetical protein